MSLRARVWLWSGKDRLVVHHHAARYERPCPAFYQTCAARFKSLKVTARIGGSEWQTSMFPSKERKSYLLPIKKAIRDAEGVEVGKAKKVKVTVLGICERF